MNVTLGRLRNTDPTWWCVMVDPDRLRSRRFAVVALDDGLLADTTNDAPDTVHRRICAAAFV